jgi:hypothetical protein
MSLFIPDHDSKRLVGARKTPSLQGNSPEPAEQGRPVFRAAERNADRHFPSPVREKPHSPEKKGRERKIFL